MAGVAAALAAETLMAVVLAGLLALGASASAAGKYTSAELKAVFLYRFAGYVQWPGAAALSPPHRAGPPHAAIALRRSSSRPPQPAPRRSSAETAIRPFTIDVLDAGAVTAELEHLVPGHPVHGRPVRVHVVRSVWQARDAQMLYIGSAYGGSLRAAIAAIAGRPILIVTDDEHGLEEGGTINFLERDRRVRFEVSLFAANRSRLRISSDLLSVAARVEGGRLHSDAHCAPGDFYTAVGAGCPTRLASR